MASQIPKRYIIGIVRFLGFTGVVTQQLLYQKHVFSSTFVDAKGGFQSLDPSILPNLFGSHRSKRRTTLDKHVIRTEMEENLCQTIDIKNKIKIAFVCFVEHLRKSFLLKYCRTAGSIKSRFYGNVFSDR